MAKGSKVSRGTPLDEFMPFDGKRFFASPFVMAMRDFQKAWYLTLLWRSWERGGYLPDDQNQLWVLAGAESREFFDKHSAIVLARFDRSGDGLLVNADLKAIYDDKICQYERRKNSSRTANASRWYPNRMRIGCESDANASHISESDSSISGMKVTTRIKTEIPENSDMIVNEIGHLYPGNEHLEGKPLPCDQEEAIANACAEDGAELVKAGTMNYRDAVATWPANERRFITNPVKFYREYHYKKDPSEWLRIDFKEVRRQAGASIGARPPDPHYRDALEFWEKVSKAIGIDTSVQTFRSGKLYVYVKDQTEADAITKRFSESKCELPNWIDDIEFVQGVTR